MCNWTMLGAMIMPRPYSDATRMPIHENCAKLVYVHNALHCAANSFKRVWLNLKVQTFVANDQDR